MSQVTKYIPDVSQLNITSAMLSRAAISTLEGYAHGQTSSSSALSKIEWELGANYVADDWEGLVEFITFTGVAGFDEFKQLLDRQVSSETRLAATATIPPTSPSAVTSQAQPSLLTDSAAWLLVRDWATETYGFHELSLLMEETFGHRYLPNEWKDIFDAIFEAFRMSDEDDAIDFSTSSVLTTKPLKALQDAMATHQVSFPTLHTPSSKPSKRPADHKGKRPAKRRRIGSTFLDLSAAEGDDESDDFDEGEAVAPTVEPAGHTSFSRDLLRIFARYEDGLHQEPRGASVGRATPPIAIDDILPPREGGHIYVVEFKIRSVRGFVQQFLEQRGLKSWEVPMLPHQLYVKASCPRDIQNNMPPSHSDVIRSITLLPDEQYQSFRNPGLSFPLYSWVRITRGVYSGDIGYIISKSRSSFDLLVVPRQRPYDEIDPDDIAEVKAAKRRERKLFDPQYAKDAGHQVFPMDAASGIVSCRGLEYHRGLLRRTFLQSSFETVLVPHPDQIALHVEANVDLPLIDRSHLLFSSQFWKEGDLVRPQVGPFIGEVATILGLSKGSVTIGLADSDVAVGAHEIPVLDLRRIFRHGDVVQVLAGLHRGCVGTVIANSGRTTLLILEGTLEVAVVCSAFLASHSSDHVVSLITGHSGVATLPPPDQSLDDTMLGDIAVILKGQYSPRKGVIQWISPDGWMWIRVMPSVGDLSAEQEKSIPPGSEIIVHSDDIRIQKPPHVLSYSKEKGYDVTLGDTLRIVRGEHHSITGVVQRMDFTQGMVELVSSADACLIVVPIQLCIKLSEFGLPQTKNAVGRDVWIVCGEKKGFRATLRSMSRDSCVVSLPGYYGIEMKHSHVCTDSGILLDGTVLEGERLQQFKTLVTRSFVTQQRNVTPPPSPKAPSPTSHEIIQINDTGVVHIAEVGGDAWSIGSGDVSSSRPEVIKGCVEWLFDDNFCDFSRHHLSFNVSAGFAGGSFVKRVVQTTCPDRFCGPVGPAPSGYVSVSVTSNHSGGGIGYHSVPANFLTPASPTSKGQLVLVLQGDLRGQFRHVLQWKRKEKTVVVESSANVKYTLSAVNVCLARSSI